MSHSSFVSSSGLATATQTLSAEDVALLRAALGSGPQVASAFAQWIEGAKPDEVHNEAHVRLFPLLYDSMTRAGVEASILPRLKRAKYRKWGEAQKKMRDGEQVLAVLADAGIPVMVSKGLALIEGYYEQVALRPMSDLDLVVKPEDVALSARILCEAGWHCDDDALMSENLRQEHLIRGRATMLTKPDGVEIDLHWQPFHECLSTDLRETYWKDAENIKVGDAGCLRPSPTMLLFHLISHGVQPNELNPLRWVADCAMILRSREDDIDWDLLFWMARKARLMRRVSLGLTELEAVLSRSIAPSPPRIFPSLIEGVEQRVHRAIRAEGAFDESEDRLFWVRRLRVLFSEASLNLDVWRAYAERKLGRTR